MKLSHDSISQVGLVGIAPINQKEGTVAPIELMLGYIGKEG